MEDFDLVTDYANSCHSKPNPAYYQDILDQFRLDPARCLMIGNDVQEGCGGRRRRGHPPPGCSPTTPSTGRAAPSPAPAGAMGEMVEYLRAL